MLNRVGAGERITRGVEQVTRAAGIRERVFREQSVRIACSIDIGHEWVGTGPEGASAVVRAACASAVPIIERSDLGGVKGGNVKSGEGGTAADDIDVCVAGVAIGIAAGVAEIFQESFAQALGRHGSQLLCRIRRPLAFIGDEKKARSFLMGPPALAPKVLRKINPGTLG